ncbi:MAG: hypothetical protein K2K96_11310 [Lachnospiraceae bacterium]|nr:hypothetical protein [Lachnospiraceae bacterium]
MKHFGNAVKFVYFFTCFWMFFSNVSFAYIDPSAVTYVVQAVAAVFIALGAILTVFRHKIAKLFKKGKKDEQPEEKIELKDIEETEED